MADPSINDVELRIVAGGRTFRYRGIRGCGSILWDLRLGLYPGTHPAPGGAACPEGLDPLWWLADSIWYDAIDPLHSSLPVPGDDPHCGQICVDLDARTIADSAATGRCLEIPFRDLLSTIDDAMAGADGVVSVDSLEQHCRHERIGVHLPGGPLSRTLSPGAYSPTWPESRDFFTLLSGTLREVHGQCWDISAACVAAHQELPLAANLALPECWTHINLDLTGAGQPVPGAGVAPGWGSGRGSAAAG